MRFQYRAARADGHIERGVMLAADQAELGRRLARHGLTLLAARPRARAARWRRVNRRELVHLFFYLEQLTRAGAPLLDALHETRDALDAPILRDAVAMLADAVDAGQRLSQAMAAQPQLFTPLMCGLIAAGEAAGALPEVLARLTLSLKQQDELRAHTRKLLLYPLFLLTLVLAVAALMLGYVVPQMADFLRAAGAEPPLATRALLAVSAWTQAYAGPLALTLAAVAMLLPGALRRHPTLARYLDRWSLRLPGVGEARQKIILARFASELAMLFSAGVPLLDSLRISEAVLDNRELQAGVAAARQRIAQGGGLADSFALTGMFPSLALRMLRIGETTGELARALDNVSYFYRRDAQDAIDRVLALVEPALTALLGLLLLWIISAVMAPVYDALSQLGQRT